MTNDETREMARLYRAVADLMDANVKLRDDYARVCGEANDFSARWRTTEQELKRELVRSAKLETEIGDWTRLADECDAARRRAVAAETRLDEMEASAEGVLLAAIPGVLESVAKRINLACIAETCEGKLPYAEHNGFNRGHRIALETVEYLRQHPKDALPAGGGE